MAHVRRYARAGALAWTLLAAGLFALPTNASPATDSSTADAGVTPVFAETAAPPADPAEPTPAPVETSAPTAELPSPEAETTPAPAATFTAEPPAGEDPTAIADAPTVAPSDKTPSEIPADTETASPATPEPTQLEPSATSDPTSGTSTITASSTIPSTAAETQTATVTASAAILPTSAGTVNATSSEAISPTSSLTVTPTSSPTISPTSSLTVTPTSSPTISPTSSLTVTPTHTPTPGAIDAAFDSGAVIINEVAWAGTLASASDEWIELWNPSAQPIDLRGWTLTDGGDLTATLAGEIAAHGLYLLERTDDSTVSDVGADRIYTGSLNNGGEALQLVDPSGNLIDTANSAGGPWPAGDTSSHASMERHGAIDLPGSWSTYPGVGGNGLDADGNGIAGTPRQPNAPAVPTATATPTTTPTASITPSGAAPTPFGPKAVIVNEVAWAGTLASSSDEWIELHNPGPQAIVLDEWRLTDDGDLDVELRGALPPGGYYVLERSDDQTISDQAADLVYAGALSNDGETLRLIDPSGTEIDVVAASGGWPAGDADSRASMERAGGVWHTFNGFNGLGRDADGGPVRGTPHAPNSVLFPTPMPTWIPGQIVINEVLMRPRYDWEGAGGVTSDDEFVELYNRGPGPVNLLGWTLDDSVVGGSRPFGLPEKVLKSGEFAVFFRSRTDIALNDDGDSVRLSAPDGSPVDKIRYLSVRAANLSYGRLPDGDDVLTYGLWPTPGKRNVPFEPASFPVGSILVNEIAWSGTRASSDDEWIELWNPGTDPVNLFGWSLTDGDDVHIHLTGTLEPGGYALLERTNEDTLSTLVAFAVYTGALADSGETLRLIDPAGNDIDVVDAGDGWPAGEPRASMERVGDEWAAFTKGFSRGHDADRQPVLGTPGGANSRVVAATLAAAMDCRVCE